MTQLREWAVCERPHNLQVERNPGQSRSVAVEAVEPGLSLVSVSYTCLLQCADDQGAGNWKVKRDPFGLRVGTVLRAFKNEGEIK